MPNGEVAGQNTAAGYRSIQANVEAWVEEKDFYDLPSFRCRKDWAECGHYVQMIWAETDKIGIYVNDAMVCSMNLNGWMDTSMDRSMDGF